MSGQRMYSVTTLLSEGLPKPALVPWAARVTAERAIDKRSILDAYLQDDDRAGAIKWLTDARWEKSGTAAARGSDIHHAAEQYALGTTPDVTDDTRPYVEQYARFLEEHQPVFIAAEAAVFNLTYSYAGTLDAIIELDGRTLVLDMKTTDKGPDHKGARPPYPEVALQATAYARAEVISLGGVDRREVGSRRYYVYDPQADHHPMPRVDGAVALVVSPADYRLVPVRTDDEAWQAFLAVREVARWQLNLGKTAIGPVITPTMPKAA